MVPNEVTFLHNILTWKDKAEVLKASCKDAMVRLQEARSLIARMLAVCKRRPEVHRNTAIGQFEFSVVPRSLFAHNGTMPHHSLKNALMRISETLSDELQYGTNNAPKKETLLRMGKMT